MRPARSGVARLPIVPPAGSFASVVGSLATRRERCRAIHSPLRVESLPLVRQRPQKDRPPRWKGKGGDRSVTVARFVD